MEYVNYLNLLFMLLHDEIALTDSNYERSILSVKQMYGQVKKSKQYNMDAILGIPPPRNIQYSLMTKLEQVGYYHWVKQKIPTVHCWSLSFLKCNGKITIKLTRLARKK